MIEVTKQKFEYFLENHCDDTSFRVVKTDNAVFYFWQRNEEIIATQTIEYGQTRRIYEVKI